MQLHDGFPFSLQQVRLGLKFGNTPIVDRFERILHLTRRQQDPEARNVFPEYLHDGFVDPLRAEVHAGAHLAEIQVGAPRIDGLLKERYARLPPEALAEERG